MKKHGIKITVSYLLTLGVSNLPKTEPDLPLWYVLLDRNACGVLFKMRIGFTWPPGAFTDDQRDAGEENLAAFEVGAARLLSSGHEGGLLTSLGQGL